jgi:hypothetical protein
MNVMRNFEAKREKLEWTKNFESIEREIEKTKIWNKIKNLEKIKILKNEYFRKLAIRTGLPTAGTTKS